MPVIDRQLIYECNFKHKKGKIASFDLDGTIITTKSGNRFPKDKNDWVLFNDSVADTLAEFDENEYDIVFFTNQKPLEKNVEKQKNFLDKINNIIDKINLPITYFICINNGYYRKPCTGAFDVFMREYGIDSLDNNSFYCGDAAGRPEGWKYKKKRTKIVNKKRKLAIVTCKKKKKDFSSSDLFFAQNCGLKFCVPEELFVNLKDKNPLMLPTRSFIGKKHDKSFTMDNIINYVNNVCENKIKPNQNMLIIMVGLPASGKSFLSKTIKDALAEKRRVCSVLNLDTVKTKNKLKKMYSTIINNNEDVIIDNTNVKEEDRNFFIDKNPNAYTIVINVTTDPEMINHLNYYRAQSSKNEKTFIGSIVYNMMKKKMVKPHKTDNIDVILEYKMCADNDLLKDKEFMYYY